MSSVSQLSATGSSFGACTIATPRQLASARVLGESLTEHHPGTEFTILLLDDGTSPELGTAGSTYVIPLRDLDTGRLHPHQLAASYEPLVLATIARPFLLQKLFDRGAEVIFYFDPEILVLSDLAEAALLTHQVGITLAPIARHPTADDRHQTTELEGIWSGTYDLGFIGLRRDRSPLLGMWAEQMVAEYDIMPHSGTLVGQRWFDALATMCPAAVLPVPRFDAAYWNLGEDDLELFGNQFRISGEAIRFFHFRGFDPFRDYILTSNTYPGDRVSLADRPILRALCNHYKELLFTQGYTDPFEEAPEYSFATLPSGIPFDERFQRVFREWQKEEDSSPSLDPFSKAGERDFLADVAKPGPGTSLPMWVAEEYRHRSDLQAVYPDAKGKDRRGLLEWARAEVGYGRLHPLLAPAEDSMDVADEVTWAKAADLRPGICLAGYLRAELGLGQQARLLLDTIKRADIPWGSYVFRVTQSRQKQPFDEAPATDFNTNVISVNADQIEHFMKEVGEEFLEDRYNIGFWAWELMDFPEQFWDAFKYVDEIWAVSDFTRAAFAAVTDKPVYTFPNPIVKPKVPADAFDRSRFNLPDGYLYLFVFDFFSEIERKNPLGLITAFSDAFSEGDEPILVIKAVNGDIRYNDLERLKVAAAGRSDVIVIDEYLDAEDNAALMAACDCYVSLHRAEGFGLTLGEAMALGKPTIGTGFSGNLQFMTEENSFLVPWTPGRVPKGCATYPAGGRWAEPDLVEAARIIRHVYEDPEDAARRAALGQKTVTEFHGLASRMKFVEDRFRQIQEIQRLRSQHLRAKR